MPNLPHNRVCELLGCSVPVVLAGMGGVSRSELVAAVTQAGGFGFLGMVREPVDLIAGEVRRLRELGHERFGVNIIPAATSAELLERQVATCIDLAVPVVGLFWDIDDGVVARLRDAGILVVYQVGSVDEAIAAERAGAGIIIAQGYEAGGHVRGMTALRNLLPDVTGAVRVPVLAAGGLSSGTDLMTAQALGAHGIVLGTAMLATRESFAHPYHKQRLVAADTGDTVLTDTFHINWPPDAPVRVLKSEVTHGDRGYSHSGEKIVIGEDEGRPIYLFSTDSPLRTTTGEFGAMALYAGTGVGLITEIGRAGECLRGVVAEAEDFMAMTGVREPVAEASSPVCYAHEMAGAYMGLLSEEELFNELLRLAGEMALALRIVLSNDLDERATSGSPPFAESGRDYAGWSLILRNLAHHVGQGRFDCGHERLASFPPEADLPLIRAAILRRLGTTIPRMAEGWVRDVATSLRLRMEEKRLALLVGSPLSKR